MRALAKSIRLSRSIKKWSQNVPLVLFLTCWAATALADEQMERFTSYPAKGGVQLKTGWNSFAGNKTNSSCIVADLASDTGRIEYVNYTEVTDTSSLMTAFSISAEAKVSSIVGGGGSASASFSRSLKIDNYGLNIAVDAMIIEEVSYLVPAGLTGEERKAIKTIVAKSGFGSVIKTERASILLADKAAEMDPITFRDACGDSFVSTIRKGTGIRGVYSIVTHSEQEKQEIAGQVGGSFGPFSGSVSSQQRVERLQHESRTSIHYFKMGGVGSPIATDDKGFRALVQRIGMSPGNPTPFEIGLTSYKSLPNYPKRGDAGKADLELMGRQYYRLYSLDKQIRDMLDNKRNDSQGYFYDEKISIARLKETQDEIQKNMTRLKQVLQQCATSPEGCVFPADTAKSDYDFRMKLPVRNGAVVSWNALQTAKANLASAQKALSATPEYLLVPPGRIENKKYPGAQLKVQKADAAVQQAMLALDSTEERFHLWIELPDWQRCGNEEDDVCIKHADLDAIKKRM